MTNLASGHIKVGRNDLCPCGSGVKFKKCHLREPGIPAPQRPVDPRSPEFQAKAWAMFDAKIAAQKKHEEQFGKVRPVVHTVAWGKRLVCSGNAIYSLDPKAGFRDFLRENLWATLGTEWLAHEEAKPFVARHRAAQWKAHFDEVIAARTPDGEGRIVVDTDGPINAVMTLAYDLHIIRDNVAVRDELLERLRRPNDFVGARYELLVGATFVRAGFHLDLENEQGSVGKVPEFLAVHRESNFVLAVEAKARNRRPSDRMPDRVGMDDHIEHAALKALARPHIPFVLFLDVAMPPEDRQTRPSWFDDVAASIDQVVAKHRSGRTPFDWVFFTNIPHQHKYAADGEPDPPRHYGDYVPATTRIPRELRAQIVAAVRQYGAIPEFEET